MSWHLNPNKNICSIFGLYDVKELGHTHTGLWLDLDKVPVGCLPGPCLVTLMRPRCKMWYRIGEDGALSCKLHVFLAERTLTEERGFRLNDLDIFQRGITRCVWITPAVKNYYPSWRGAITRAYVYIWGVLKTLSHLHCFWWCGMLVSQMILTSEPHVVNQFHQKAGSSLGFRGPWCFIRLKSMVMSER